MSDCEVVKIDSNITGLRYAVEECIGQLGASVDGVEASGLATFAANPAAADTVTIGAKTYTFRTALSAGPTVANEVLIGATALNTAFNLRAAINGDYGAGNTYSTGTVANASVQASAGTDATVALRARAAGTAGNALATTKSATNPSFGAATLTGGVNEVDGDVVWTPLEPNTYTDFGGQTTTVVRNPINPSRQRKKGVVTDLDASGTINQDLTQTNVQDLMQGYLFADIRVKTDYDVLGAAGDLTITSAGNFATLGSTALDFTTLGLIPGEWIFVGGDAVIEQFANEENNGFKRIRSIAAHALVLDKSDSEMSVDAGSGKTVHIYMGRVLKNETGALIKRRTYQLERTLGSLDGLDPPQAEYLIGAVPSQAVLNLTTAQKVTADLGFIAIDNEQRTQAQGLKAGARPAIVESDAFDTSSDVKRIRFATTGGADEAPVPLFGYCTDFALTINNSLTANKAIGKLGAIDVTAGTFAVSATATAYFSDIKAITAVRENDDVSVDMIFVKKNAGIVLDLPLVALGNARATVVLDQPIMLPLTADAASAAKIDESLDYTLLFVFFDVLPDLASV